MQSTGISELTQIFEAQKQYSSSRAVSCASERKEKIRKLYREVRKRQPDIEKALNDDLRKCTEEARLIEIYPMLTTCRMVMRNLRKWMRPKWILPPLALTGARCKVTRIPKGVCLVMSPWNYPFELCMSPAVYALAAGNCVTIKPSEYALAVSRVIREIFAGIFNENEVAVIDGGPETGKSLTELPFDHIYFTGSPAVGKLVMKAASQNLTSVTLELGGKSPVIIDDTADPVHAAEKVVWGKMINCGQTCIAPDYVVVHESKKEAFLSAAALHLRKFLGPDDMIKSNPEYPRVIHEKHFQRIKSLYDEACAKGASVVVGGEFDRGDRFISPTILVDVPHDSGIMTEEIFGPVLPVLTYSTADEVIGIVKSRPVPLVLYIFSNDSRAIDLFTSATQSGDVLINDTLVHYGNIKLPFGGKGESGIGKSHGESGFAEFSHTRSVMRQPMKSMSGLIYPPYSNWKKRLIDLLVDYF